MSCLAATAVLAAPAWTWLDENGQRHFSDRPVPGATRIDLPDSPGGVTVGAGAVQRAEATTVEPEQAPAEPVRYTTFNILNPAHQDTLWNIGGNLSVTVQLEPELQPGHRLDAYLDGERIEVGATGSQLTIPNVFRGLHEIQAVVVDMNTGEDVLRSLAITVMVQQTSLLNPNNPNN
jgi:hypothetical protein